MSCVAVVDTLPNVGGQSFCSSQYWGLLHPLAPQVSTTGLLDDNEAAEKSTGFAPIDKNCQEV